MTINQATLKNLALRVFVLLVGVAITALGVGGYVAAQLGADPTTAFMQGFSQTLGLSFGVSISIFNAFFLLVLLVTNRKLIHLATLINAFFLGAFADAAIALVQPLASLALPGRTLLVFASTAALALGLGLQQAPRLGAGPMDGFNQVVAQKTGIPLRWERMGFDTIMVIGALQLGGNVHFGTVVGMLGVGPIMAFVMHRVSGWIDQITVQK